MSLRELEVCVLTPAGRGAIATIALAGAEAPQVAQRYFQPISAKNRLEPNRVCFGLWTLEEAVERVKETVVICQTGTDELEIHCHGGTAVSRAIVDSLVDGGAVERSSVQWQHKKHGRLHAEFIAALQTAPSARCARMALDQINGAFRKEIQEIIDDIQCGTQQQADDRLHELLRRSRFGETIEHPFRVMLAGPPNVGKSSLINAILGYQRAITDSVPGTTRDRLSAVTNVDGWPIEFLDTAGIRASTMTIEKQGIELAVETVAEVDLVLIVVDASMGWSETHQEIASRAQRSCVVWNKVDLVENSHDTFPGNAVATSMETGEGLDRLLTRVVEELVPEAPAKGDSMAVNRRQRECLQAAYDAIDSLERIALLNSL